MTTYGASAPLKALQEKFGFTTDKAVAQVLSFLDNIEKQSAAMKQPAVFALPTHYEFRSKL